MSSILINRSKIVPPQRRNEILTRKRLLEMLFNGLNGKLVLISAPAGYGKTSLLIDAAEQSEYTVCWLSLDELDRVPETFVAYMVASIAEKYPGFGTQTLAALKGISSIDEEIEKAAVALVHETLEMIQEHFILILDDFHMLEGVKSIYDFLDRFIQLMHDHCHLVISSRKTIYVPNLPRLIAHHEASGFDYADLAFRMDEIQALIWQNRNIHLSDEAAQKLVDETEGWITGLQFSSNDLDRTKTIKPAAADDDILSDYLGQQVLDHQTPEIRTFLLRTSLMSEFDAALCESVLAPLYDAQQDWNELIHSVFQNNLFALPVGDKGRSLRYHNLFLKFLRKQLEKERHEEIDPILVRLGQAYEKDGQWEKAYYVTQQLDDMDALAGVIERASFNNLQNISKTASNWLRDLPPSIRQNRPGILSVGGTLKLIKGEYRDGIFELDRAVEAFRQADDIPQLAMALIRRSTGYRYIEEHEASIRDAEEAIGFCQGRDDLQSLCAEALHVKGAELYRQGKMREALTYFDQAYDILIRLKDMVSLPEMLEEIGITQQALGNFDKAEQAYTEALKVWKESGNVWAQSAILNNIGNLHHQSGDYKKAASAYDEGILCARRSHHLRMEVLISIGMGDLFTELQDYELASQCYHDAEKMLQDRNDEYSLFWLHYGRANLALAKNEIDEAGKFIIRIEKNARPNQLGCLHLVKGKFYLKNCAPQEAVEMLESAAFYFQQKGLSVDYAFTRIWLIAACLSAKKHDLAVKLVQEAFDGSRISHISLVAISQTRKWLEVLRKDAKVGRSLHDPFTKAERLLAQFSDIRREIRWHSKVVDVPAAPLVIKGFGSARVLIAGKELSISDWPTNSVRNLFFYFFTQSRKVSKDQVAEELWTDLDEPAKISLRFKNEMYRLRRAVGREVICYESDKYFFDHSLNYEYDVAEFESHINRAKSSQKIEEQIECYRRAVDLVSGPYLDDIYYDWAMADRKRLGDAYLLALVTLAELYRGRALLEESLAMCQRAIKYEPTYEGAYQVMMRVYARIGDHSAIVQTYQDYITALSQFSLDPALEMKSLYQSLIS